MALPRRVIRLVQILFADHPPGSRIEQHDVSVRTDHQSALARVEPHDFGGVRRRQPDKIGEAVAAFGDHVRVHQGHPRLDPGIAAGRVVDPIALQFHLQRAAHLVSRDRLDRAVIGSRPQRGLVLREFQRRVGVEHLPAGTLVVFGRVKQVLVQRLPVHRKPARA